MTDRVVGFALCLLAVTVLAVPSKAQALPVLLSVQSTQVTFAQDLNDNALLLHSGVFRGNWLGLIPWGGGGGFIFGRLIISWWRWRRRHFGIRRRLSWRGRWLSGSRGSWGLSGIGQRFSWIGRVAFQGEESERTSRSRL